MRCVWQYGSSLRTDEDLYCLSDISIHAIQDRLMLLFSGYFASCSHANVIYLTVAVLMFSGSPTSRDMQ
jgi:hypothetical protein